ncbi:hypothetical protein A3K79_04975 [Candidatus Bathyarchaeota archaeon RBG_13_46_16b]|nr:MAG: hypothetical protein A3K79_04975 [Candidatus Bathyarchaeota archaeon RBG_13_46_16b]
MKGLHKVFEHYDEKDIKHALLAAIDLFHGLATEAAEKMSYSYPTEATSQVAKWIRSRIS